MPANSPLLAPSAMMTMPDLANQQQGLLQRQALAQMLRGQSAEAPQGQMISGNYVAPSWTQHLSRLAQGLGATYLDDKNKTEQTELNTNYAKELGRQIDSLFGSGGRSNIDSTSIGGGELGGQNGGEFSTQSMQAQPQPLAPESQQLRNAAKAAYLMGNKELANRLLGNALEITNEQKNWAAQGIDPRSMGQYAVAEAKKKGIIELQPGTTAIDLASGQERFQPKVGEGIGLNNRGAYSIPGYGQANAEIAGAQAGAVSNAQAQNKLITVNTPGGPVMLTEAQAAQMAAGSGQPSSPQGIQFQNPNGANLNLQGVSPQQGINELSRINNPADRAAALQAAGQWTQSPAPTPGIKLAGEANKAFEQGQGKYFADTYSKLQDNAAAASQRSNNYDRLSQLLQGIDTGSLTPSKMQIAAVADSLGIKVDPNLGTKQAAESLSNGLALEIRNPQSGAGMPGAMSDADREYLKSMSPGLNKTPEGNRLLIETAKKIAARDQEIAGLAREYVNRKGQLDNGFYQELQQYSAANPLFQTKKPMASKGGFEILGVSKE